MSRPAPLSLRLSRDERALLEREAGDLALGAYIKRRLFADAPLQAGRRQLPVRDQRTIAQTLARLGASGLAAHMREIADAARSGSLECDDALTEALAAACADIRSIRLMLVTALGLKGPQPPRAPTSTPRRAFTSAAAPEDAA